MRPNAINIPSDPPPLPEGWPKPPPLPEEQPTRRKPPPKEEPEPPAIDPPYERPEDGAFERPAYEGRRFAPRGKPLPDYEEPRRFSPRVVA